MLFYFFSIPVLCLHYILPNHGECHKVVPPVVLTPADVVDKSLQLVPHN